MNYNNLAYYLILVLTLSSCDDAVKDWVKGGGAPIASDPSVSPAIEQAIIWDFSDPTKYTYNSTYVEVMNGSASLKQVDQMHSGADFNNGSHFGTVVDDNGQVTIKTKLHDSLNVKNILPNKVSNLVGYWRMDNNWNDESAYSNHATPFGLPIFSKQSQVGETATVFDTTPDYLQVADHPAIKQQNIKTISLWVKKNGDSGSAAGYSYVIRKGVNVNDDDIHLIIYDGNPATISFVVSKPSIASAVGASVLNYIVQGAWYQIVCVLEPSLIKLYANGLLLDSALHSELMNNSSAVMGIGSIGSSTWGSFNGEIDEVAIWNTPLTALEISTLYKIQAQNYIELSPFWTPRWNNIVGYWKMDGNWQDFSGNNHNGTPSNGAGFSASSRVGTQAGIFDGVDDFVRTTIDILPLQASSTFSAWIYRTGISPNDQDGIISKQYGGDDATGSREPYLSILGSKLRFLSREGGTNYIALGSTTIALNKWYYVVGVRDQMTSKLRVYVNARLDGEVNGTGITIIGETDSISIGANYHGGALDNFRLIGNIDDAAVWNVALSSEEINVIYNRQKQKYAGHYDSPVIDIGTAVPWGNIIPTTNLPYFKAISGSNSSESSSDYADLSGDLNNGLVGLWHLDEASWNGTIDEVRGLIGKNENGQSFGGLSTQANGILSRSANFDTVGKYVTTPFDGSVFNSDFTVTAWFKHTSQSEWATIVSNATGGILDTFVMTMRNNTNEFGINRVGAADTGVFVDLGPTHFDKWIFGVVRRGGGTLYIDAYMNTEHLSASGALNWTLNNSNSLYIGKHWSGGTQYYLGLIDEVAIWNRNLTASEIEQIYRRGANRVKYQIKSCVDSSCNCDSFNMSPEGTMDDCDGDGINNLNDTSDNYLSKWIGRNGAAGSTFSELQNCSGVDGAAAGTGDCTVAATVNSSSANFVFSNFPPMAQPENNPYFQYRVLMEAEENSACLGGTTTCMPALTAIEIGPSGRYYGGSPEITSIDAVDYTNLNEMTFSEFGSCSVTYQLSPDGTTYYYWNGTGWVSASGIGQTSNSSTISSNIVNFSSQLGGGSLYWKAFMTSDTSQSCGVSEISMTVYK